MRNSTIIKLALAGLLVIVMFVVGSNFVGFSNTEIEIHTTFDQKIKERTAFYDKMYKIIAQQSQIAVKNDESFKENVNAIMENRKDSPQLFMKWVTESNPNANYNEVSELYKTLSRSVEAQREGFFVQEKVLMDVERQHKNLIQKFPGSFYNYFLDRKAVKYEPIQSSLTQGVMKTGIDDSIKLDL